MSYYYEPVTLFRSNALRRSKDSFFSDEESTTLSRTKNIFAPWLMNFKNGSDTEVANKSCSLNTINFSSNYWRIPDTNMNLTSMDVNSRSADEVTGLAIASANASSNLFLYELNSTDNYLSHSSTITLPHIHSIKWVPDHPNLLLAGNRRGYAHLIWVPCEGDTTEQAEIYKRFNHRKHLKSINKSSSVSNHKSTAIKDLAFMGNNLLSIYDGNLFAWDLNGFDTQSKPKPLSIAEIHGLAGMDSIPESRDLVGICGRFGVSLFDSREASFSVPSSVLRETHKRKLGATMLKWNPIHEHMCAAYHNDGIVRLWDIRKQDHFATLDGYQHAVTSMEWANNDLLTGGKHGSIVHWDLSGANLGTGDPVECTLNEGFNSVKFNPNMNSIESVARQRQCGTFLPASNYDIVSMCSMESTKNDDTKVLSIDSSALFGVHSRLYENINIENDCELYSAQQLELITESNDSVSTLCNSSAELLTETKPLEVPSRTISGVSGDQSSIFDNTVNLLQDNSVPKLPEILEENEIESDIVSFEASEVDTNEQSSTTEQALVPYIEKDDQSIPSVTLNGPDEREETEHLDASTPSSDAETFYYSLSSPSFILEHENFSGDSLVDSFDSATVDMFNTSMESFSTNPTIVDEDIVNHQELESTTFKAHHTLPSLSSALEFNFAFDIHQAIN